MLINGNRHDFYQRADALEEEFVKGNIGPWQDWWYRDYKYELRKKGCYMEEVRPLAYYGSDLFSHSE